MTRHLNRKTEANLTKEEYEHIRDYYLEPKNEWARQRIERVTHVLKAGKGEHILDLGCGNGTFSFHLRRAGAVTVGVDRDENVLLKGRAASNKYAGFAAPRVAADATRLPFREAVFDAVVNADFIEHTPGEAKPAIFQEMYRVLKPGGRGIVYTPNLNRVRWELMGEKVKRIAGLRKEPVPKWWDYVDPDHFGLTTPARTRRAMERAGFRTKVYFFEFHFPGLSRLPFLDRLLEPLFREELANRFLILGGKPAE